MDNHTATELAYKNGYEQGQKDAVKHGVWKRVGGDLHSSGYAVSCSNCGKYHFVHYRGSLGSLYGHDELFNEPPDCPNCGARMDGDNHD